MSTSTKPIIELDLSKYMPSYYDLARIFEIVDLVEDEKDNLASDDTEISAEEIEWLEKELESIDDENEAKEIESHKNQELCASSIYI